MTPGRRFPIGSEAPRAPAWLRGLGPPQKRHKTKTKGGLTTGNGELVRLMRDLFVIISLMIICTQSGACCGLRVAVKWSLSGFLKGLSER